MPDVAERQGDPLDLLVVGAGPTGIAVAAEARRAGLAVLAVDRGPLVASLQAYPTDLTFFTTRERLEIAGVPFTVPDVKPNRRQALVYYREVVKRHRVPLALYEEVEAIRPDGGGFLVASVKDGLSRQHRARAVAVATGYFWWPVKLGVPGEELPWVHSRYVEPYPHIEQDVVVVGGSNSAVKAALDLWRNGARVTLVHRGEGVGRSVKYWLRPDFENRVAEGSIAARYRSRVRAFLPATAERPAAIEVAGPTGVEAVPTDAAYVLIGYAPDVSLLTGCGVEVDPSTLVPAFDPESCETNVAGLYVAGTLQAGRETNKIFIENSRDHGARIVAHLARRLGRPR
jgi:bacillithiol disulfide reductase